MVRGGFCAAGGGTWCCSMLWVVKGFPTCLTDGVFRRRICIFGVWPAFWWLRFGDDDGSGIWVIEVMWWWLMPM
jgi:hypothetical protein